MSLSVAHGQTNALDLPSGGLPVDIIVPVYRNLELTRRCIASVLGASCTVPWHLVLIDDASPEPALSALLDDMAQQAQVTVLRNPQNMGFVATVNRGMALHADRDVVLLNSDTEVYGDWLDRLQAAASRVPDIATVTPFSNNATICSYPHFCADNPLPEGWDGAALDRLFSQVNHGRWLPIPTAVGFCMYIRRACLEQVGMFDALRFGKGYGEENDFSLRAARLGWRHALAGDVFVWHAGGASFGTEREVHLARGAAALTERYPEYEGLVSRFVALDPVWSLRQRVDVARVGLKLAQPPRHGPATPQDGSPAASDGEREGTGTRTWLHVIHDLGGGAEAWLGDFCTTDGGSRHLVLRPLRHDAHQARGMLLLDAKEPDVPVRIWRFEQPIPVSLVEHAEYASVIADVLASYPIDGILVSSLIGHAMAVLDTGLPTVFVGHDYFPFCPDINLYFSGICRQCDVDRLAECHAHNAAFDHFPLLGLADRLALRQAFLDRLDQPNVILAIPSESVRVHLEALHEAFARATFVHIPHGYPGDLKPLPTRIREPGDRMRILVLGQITPQKGKALLEQVLPEMVAFADVYLLGCRELGALFLGMPNVHVLPDYDRADLGNRVAGIEPDLGLLLSLWPETYSYTLTELLALGIPPVATRTGAFAERIREGETGFLCDPAPEPLLALLGQLRTAPARLERVRATLAGWRPRPLADMVDDYHRILAAIPGGAGKRLSAGTGPELPSFTGQDERWPLTLELIRQWKTIQSLEVQRHFGRDQLARVEAEVAHVRHLLADAQGARERPVPDIWEARAGACESALAAILVSTSWRITAPVRGLGNALRKARTLGRCLAPLAQSPALMPGALGDYWRGWRKGGWVGLKDALVTTPERLAHRPLSDLRPVGPGADAVPGPEAASDQAQPVDWRQATWQDYRQRRDAGLPGLCERIPALPRHPLISVLVPVFNTPESMLRAMLDSVLGQIYPHWELCLADDGSSQAHVATVLEDYARRDARIRPDFTSHNRGVSAASNRALALARGEFVVLLDHDDMLEPQALFRVAEACLAHDPDMLYSDELLVEADGETVQHYIFRPAFSAEYLRSHPYIVHLVGFRTDLLRRVGGFDEHLHISQDYDLILRAAEAAGRILHIPEMLYRWRIHPDSAGHARIHEVMDTSRAILERHLARCGEPGQVEAGVSFNYFETRYPLREGLRVAIIIPTRNQGALVTTCIESIEATASGVDWDIVLVDHDSDDPESLACFADLESRLGPRLRRLRQSGPFNFSVLNNRAVASLAGGGHSHYLFCNNDVEALTPGWLERMLELGQKPDVGIVGAKLYYPDRTTIQHAGVVVACCGVAENLGRFRQTTLDPLDLGYVGSLIANHELSAVTAACLLIRSDVFHRVGGFDEALAVGYGDVDLNLRVRELGYRVLFCPHASLVHHESYTRGRHPEDPHPEDSRYFTDRWQGYYLGGDPYFNPNLSAWSPDWQVAQPLPWQAEIRPRLVLAPWAGTQPDK